MDSILTVTAPAGDLTLLTIEELRHACGVQDSSQDRHLEALGLEVAARLTETCNIVEGVDSEGNPVDATLRLEEITETFLMRQFGEFGNYYHTPISSHYWRNPRENPTLYAARLNLSRRPIVSVVSITEGDPAYGGCVLSPADFQIDGPKGEIIRLMDGLPLAWWPYEKLVCVYQAGFATVPNNLKMAARRLARIYWFEEGRDPKLRQVSVPGVIERSYFGADNSADVPQAIVDMLRPYRNVIMA